jgi:hypothetical protein
MGAEFRPEGGRPTYPFRVDADKNKKAPNWGLFNQKIVE